jgi:cell division protein FtsW
VAQRLKTDWILYSTVLVMVFLGIVMVYSASSIMAEVKFHSMWYFSGRQALWLVPSIAAMMFLKRTNYRQFQNPGIAFAAIGVALILLIVVYLADARYHRWLRFGPVGLQPSEFAKPALVVFLAYFVTMRAKAINDRRHTLIPAALATGLVIFMVVVADLGTAVVLGATTLVVFLMAGLEWRYFVITGAVALVGLCGFIISKPYRVARVVGYLDPDYTFINRVDRDGRIKAYLRRSLTSRDTSYQVEQSRIAVGAGGITGQGMTHGRQKLLYLPEPHTDFIYAVVAEELGLIGAGGVLFGFLVIFWRGLRTSVLIYDDFGRYLALGITTMIVVQAMINMSVVLGMMPTKGIPLPLISFGGSSLLSTLASLGMLMNVAEHAG